MKLKICTWNINHLSDQSEKRDGKLKAITKVLLQEQPDIMVLQEVNSIDASYLKEAIKEVKIRPNLSLPLKKRHKDFSPYILSMGPMMKCVGSVYNKKDGTQYEYYPIIYRAGVHLESTYAILMDVKNEGDVTDVGPVEWVSDRPLMVHRLRVDEEALALGVIHTSPSSSVERNGYKCLWRLDMNESSRARLIAGDWYIEKGASIVVGWDHRSQKNTWSDILTGWKYDLAMPSEKTNFPDQGNGMVADYFVVEQKWQVSNVHVVPCVAIPMGEVSGWAPACWWKKLGLSDHAPVCGTFER